MIYPYQLSFKTFIENDPILYSLFFEKMRWGDVEVFEDVEKKNVI